MGDAIAQTTTNAKKIIEGLIRQAGIVIDGPNQSDVKVHNERIYQRIMHTGALGLGEAYMDKWWDCPRLDIFTEKILHAHLDGQVSVPISHRLRLLLSTVINFQTKRLAKEVAQKHYDLSNALFTAMLDKRMNYSCGYWKNARNLEEAQLAKLDLICQKLQLHPGLSLLDIGCGFGSLAKHAAENYGVKVVGITISKHQYEYATQYCKGLPIEIRLQDYRDVHQQFDRIASVGMFEHVGPLNYRCFMQTVHDALAYDGLFLLHTIGSNETSVHANAWIVKYIFPNGALPSIAQIGKAYEKLFIMEDWHSFGAYYDNTLMSWYDNFIGHWQQLKKDFDERFYRMWTYYLLTCAGSFRARVNQLWQIVFSKNGLKKGYLAPR